MEVIPITPPRAAISRMTWSGLQRRFRGFSERQLACVISTGFFDARIASRLVQSPQCEMSTAMPAPFIASITRAP